MLKEYGEEMKKRRRRKQRKLPVGKGMGHGGKRELPEIRRVPLTATLERMQEAGQVEGELRLFRMGNCRIIVGRSNEAGWHLSISHPRRYPTWDEVARARYELCPGELTMTMLLPPEAEYVNIHDNCFHLWELRRA